MPDDSDTESSESERPGSTATYSFLESLNVSRVSPETEGTISDAIEEIERVQLKRDIQTIAEDTNIHIAISSASSRIINFLDSVHQSSCSAEDAPWRLSDFGKLLNVSFLEVMFGHRKIFHQIAAQSLVSEPASSGAIVCWVDVILFKLGDASIAIAGGNSLDMSSPLFGSTQVRDEDGLRAASQLPSEWHSVVGVIASNQASPAAKRLALRLTFAAFILGPRLCRRNLPIELPTSMIEVLDRYVNQTHATGFSTGYAGNQLAMQERLNFAMIISLFAASDRKDRILSQRSRLRPHTLGRLLNLLQNVMHPENTVALLQLATPPDELDPAQVMLIRWGDSVSWSWETWDDHRVADAESIVFLTSTWLLHSAHPFLSDGREPESDSTSVSTASGIAILRVLHHVVLALLPSASPSSTSMTVISRACFNAAESMRHLLSRQKEDERWMLSGFCKYLLSLFVLVVVETDEWLCVTDYILEALSQVDADTLRACLMHIQGDSNLRFSARLDERLTHVKKCVTIILAQDPHTQIWKLNFVRSALNFAVILWFSQTRGCLLRQSVSPFLSTIIEFLLLESSPSLPSKILGDAIFTASAAARKDPFWTDDNQESLWQFAINSPLSNIGIASSFAHYIIASEGPCNSLYCAEAWRYLGEILLLILERQYIEEQEPLALLTCPTVCVGLMRLLQADAAATQFMVSTPLTLNLCAGLKAVCESTRSEQYFTVLKEKLGVVGPCLLDQILLKSRGEAPKIFEDVPMRLIFYRMYGVSHLVFVSDI